MPLRIEVRVQDSGPNGNPDATGAIISESGPTSWRTGPVAVMAASNVWRSTKASQDARMESSSPAVKAED